MTPHRLYELLCDKCPPGVTDFEHDYAHRYTTHGYAGCDHWVHLTIDGVLVEYVSADTFVRVWRAGGKRIMWGELPGLPFMGTHADVSAEMDRLRAALKAAPQMQ